MFSLTCSLFHIQKINPYSIIVLFLDWIFFSYTSFLNNLKSGNAWNKISCLLFKKKNIYKVLFGSFFILLSHRLTFVEKSKYIFSIQMYSLFKSNETWFRASINSAQLKIFMWNHCFHSWQLCASYEINKITCKSDKYCTNTALTCIFSEMNVLHKILLWTL
jgi:hypothetical protein